MADKEQDDDRKHRAARAVPVLEWVCGLGGAAIAVAMMGFLTFEGLTRAQTPADLNIEVTGARETAAGLALDLRVVNSGGTTAADVSVRSSSEAGKGGEATIDFVPRMSERRAVLILPAGTDPRTVSPMVQGYRDP
ncbi:MAG: hypothetical protein AB1698_04790 [Pseudomonadota bacterium]